MNVGRVAASNTELSDRRPVLCQGRSERVTWEKVGTNVVVTVTEPEPGGEIVLVGSTKVLEHERLLFRVIGTLWAKGWSHVRTGRNQ